MRFMIMHKHQPSVEADAKPSPELIQRMGALMGEHMKAGRMFDGAGLGPSQTRTRITAKGGQLTVKNGPYAGERELPALTMLLKTATREEAIGWAERYAKTLGDGEVEIGKITEPWDLGVMPAPANPPFQGLLIEKASAASEKNERPAKQKADLTRLRTEMTKAGVLLRMTTLLPSAKGKRLFFTNNDLRTVDGPFTESKELIGGFAVMEFPNYDDVIAMTRIYADILGGNLEVDIREVDLSDDAA